MPRPPERAPQRRTARRGHLGGDEHAAARRARRVRAQPRVDAGGVEAVVALRQHAHGLPVLELHEADGALLRLAAAAVGDVRHGRERPQHLLLDALVRRGAHRRRRQPLSAAGGRAQRRVHAHRATRPRPRTQMSAQSSPARMTTRSELSESSTEPEAAASRSILAMAGTPGDRSNRRKMA